MIEKKELQYPYEFCEACGGEGVDYDPMGMFDYPCMYACPKCKESEERDELLEGVRYDQT